MPITPRRLGERLRVAREWHGSFERWGYRA